MPDPTVDPVPRSDRRVDASRKGLPRPLLQGLPAPYSGVNSAHGKPDSERLNQCVSEQLCAVCGETLDPGALRYVATPADWWLLSSRSRPLLADQGAAMDERCARLALAHCPEMRNGHAVVFGVRADELEEGVDLGGGLAWKLAVDIERDGTRELRLRTTAKPTPKA